MTKQFFIGTGKLRIWYLLFYIIGLPLNILGIFLFSQLRQGQGPQGGEIVLSIISLGYLLLGFFSLINTILYVHKTRKYLFASTIFFGLQILFWIVGYGLGNNYRLLLFFFIISLCITIYANLKALQTIQKPHHSSQK